jgi:hypothetical protein
MSDQKKEKNVYFNSFAGPGVFSLIIKDSNLTFTLDHIYGEKTLTPNKVIEIKNTQAQIRDDYSSVENGSLTLKGLVNKYVEMPNTQGGLANHFYFLSTLNDKIDFSKNKKANSDFISRFAFQGQIPMSEYIGKQKEAFIDEINSNDSILVKNLKAKDLITADVFKTVVNKVNVDVLLKIESQLKKEKGKIRKDFYNMVTNQELKSHLKKPTMLNRLMS